MGRDTQTGGDDGTRLDPFVPRLAVELQQERASSASANVSVTLAGSMLSADISGFTALSERLAGKGKAGAEEITELINRCFTAMIDAAYEFGGEVLKFGGDALLILFRGDDHEVRCAGAGLAMQEALTSSSAAKRANLSMTVGCAEGPFDVFVVGSDYRELLVTGPAASEVIRLEAAAYSGETLVSVSIAELLEPGQRGQAHDGGVAAAAVPDGLRIGADTRDHAEGDLTRFVPPAVVEQLSAFAELGGEHRLVTVGFAMVKGIEEQLESDRDGLADVLGSLVDNIVEACDPVGVTVLHTDIAPDGVKFVLCAGAPLTRGDTSDAMLTAALQIASVDTPLDVRIGVQRGRVFAGFLGSAYRRTYTLMGDPVNTAARMLGQADRGEVVAVDDVVADSRTIFHTEAIEPFLVKGKTEPITAHRVLSSSDERRRGVTTAGFVGREDELLILKDALLVGGRVVHIVGPAGVGKSHLVDAALRQRPPDLLVRGTCSQYNAFTPYSVFRPAFWAALDLPENTTPAEAGARIADTVSRRCPELTDMLPLLAIPFGAEVAPTDAVDAIDPEFRRARMHETLVAFIDAAMPPLVVLVIEDVHWIDAASADLLTHLVDAAAKRDWAAILTARPNGLFELASEHEHTYTIELDPLDEADIRRLTVDVSTRPLRDNEIDLIVERSQGNPLFVVELAQAVSAGKSELPDTVEELIGDRIDNLEPAQRLLVRVAAVIGLRFDMRDLVPVARVAVPNLDPLEILGLEGLIEVDVDGRCEFAHGLYHETSYEGLPYKRRKELHLLVGEHLETVSTARMAADPMVLSMHFHRAQDFVRSWKYSRRAGAAAQAQGASQEAAEALERAQQASRRLPSLSDEDRLAVNEELGDAWFLTGQFDQAATGFKRARRLCVDVSQTTRLMQKEGEVRERLGQSDQAMRWYNRALRLIPDDTSEIELVHSRSSIHLAQAGLRHRQTQHRKCAQLATKALIDATRSTDVAMIAKSHERLHLAFTYLRDSRSRHHGVRAKDLYGTLGDLRSSARVLVTMGIEAHFAGDWNTAAQRYAETTEAAERSGDRIVAEIGKNNRAEVLSDQGHWGQAVELFADLHRTWTASSYAIGAAVAGSNLGFALARTGQTDEAMDWFLQAIATFADVGASDFVLEGRLRQAETLLLAGDLDRAEPLLGDLLEQLPDQPEDAEESKAVSRLWRLRGALEYHRGERSLGEAHLIDSLVMAIAAGDDFLASLAHVELANIGVNEEHHNAQATTIFASLGVIAIAELLRQD